MWYITRRYIKQAVFSWGPVLAAMLIMFVASAQPKFGPPPDADPLQIYFSGALPVFPGIWEFAIKKSAHVIAYGVLALLFMRALLVWMPNSRGWLTLRRSSLLAVALALGYALADELHQSFVPGRHASLVDIGLDLSGAILFTAIAWQWHHHRTNAPTPSPVHAHITSPGREGYDEQGTV